MKITFVFIIFMFFGTNTFAQEGKDKFVKFMLQDMQSNISINRDVLVHIKEGDIEDAIEVMEIQIDLQVCRIWEMMQEVSDDDRKRAVATLKKIKLYRTQYPVKDSNADHTHLSSYYKETRKKAEEILSKIE